MELDEGSKYKVKKSRENLYAVMNEHFAMDEKAVVAALKRGGFKQFDPKDWYEYIMCLTRHAPCRYCDSPQKQPKRMPIGPKYLDGYVCLQNRKHYLLQATEDLMSFHKGQILAESYCREECEHGDIRKCCVICDESIVDRRRLSPEKFQLGG